MWDSVLCGHISREREMSAGLGYGHRTQGQQCVGDDGNQSAIPTPSPPKRWRFPHKKWHEFLLAADLVVTPGVGEALMVVMLLFQAGKASAAEEEGDSSPREPLLFPRTVLGLCPPPGGDQ